MKLRKVVAVYDVHVPKNINLSPLNNFLVDFQPDDFVVGGDFLNLDSISHWNDKNFANIGFSTVRRNLHKEFAAGRKVIEDWVKILPKGGKKYYIPGNHEWWLVGFATKYPQIFQEETDMEVPEWDSDYTNTQKTFFSKLLNHYLHLEEYGFEIQPYMRPLKIGKIYFVHGHEFGGGNNHAKSMVEKGKKNIVGGHVHTHQVYTSYSPLDFSEFHSGVSVPCLTGLGPGYLQQPNTKWLNGFYAALMQPDGFYHDYVLKIIKGKLITPDGKIYQ